MVNTGGPSKGCITCIRRKIRCDRQRPVCGQCQRSCRQCEGYRDPNVTMFRDQSQVVLDRIRAADLQRTQRETTIVRAPRLNAENGLIAFFANNFTCGGSNAGSKPPGTNLFWVPSNFEDLLKNDCASLSVQSVGAMALARLRRSNDYFREAQRKYGQALLTLAESWQQQTDIDKDAVLITTFFLAFFEILASYDSSSRQSWITHLGGFGMLLNRRNDQFRTTAFGVRMLLQSRSQAILDALQTKTPVSETFLKPFPTGQRSIPPQFLPFHNADTLLIRLATIQARCQSIGSSTAMVAALTALDGDCCQWIESLPSSWSFSAQLSERPSDLWWEARCDVYPTAVMEHVWNKVRTARIIIHNLIQELVSPILVPIEDIIESDFLVGQEENTTFTADMRQLVADICATIPIYYRPTPTAYAEFDSAENRPLLGTTYWVLWPLEVVGSMVDAPLQLKTWVLQCLDRIHDTTGIAKAQVAASRLRMRYGYPDTQ